MTATMPAVTGQLLATGATTATRDAGPCSLCQHAILRGERYATLLSGRLAHAPCIGRAARTPLARVRTRPQVR